MVFKYQNVRSGLMCLKGQENVEVKSGHGQFMMSCLLFLVLLPVLAVSHSTVQFLPGFQGPLPFELETGYIGVGESEDVQLFYYFVKSERTPKEDPLLLWLTGGPGCSGFSALAFEIGPITFELVEYNGSLPTLVLNPHSLTQVSSIIFIDLPAGTGFSYATTPVASQTGDLIQVYQADQFLRKWLMDHPEFLSNPVYIGGHSYVGIPLPAIVHHISNGNEKGIKPLINLKGYLLGNPSTDVIVDGNSRILFTYGMGLISEELYESLKRSCGGEYQTIDPSNRECLKHMQAFDKCISGINEYHILEPKCATDSPRPMDMFGKRRSLYEKYYEEFLDLERDLPTFGCPNYGYVLARYWVNNNDVHRALHVREGSVGKWQRCNSEIRRTYTYDIDSSVKYHLDLGTKGYRRLIYSGDHDMAVPFLGTQAWIRSLNYSIIDDWRSWHNQGQVAGYTRTYSNQMTFATVKGGEHVAPKNRPAECFAMYTRWLFEQPL